MTGAWILLAAVLVAVTLGVIMRTRSGALRAASPGEPARLAQLLLDAGLGDVAGAPLLLHFSAAWCGPCAGVRQVVDVLAGEFAWLRHIEVDVAAHPELAAELRVLSLPTVLVFDAELRQRFRAAGAPSTTGLRAVLLPLAPGGAAPDPAAG